MSHAIQSLNGPGILLPTAQSQMAQAMATAKAAASTGTTSSATAASGTNLGTTFLNLLSKELQNQDPTAPVDSTAMVGQMISLNQLDQLISINQTLGATPTSVTSPTATAGASTPAAGTKAAVTPALDPASTLSNAQAMLPFDPNTMMPIATTSATQTSFSGAK